MGRVYVYVDETGDRGSSSASSPVFGMAAIVLDDDGAAEVRRAVDTLRADFKVPATRVMSWKDHVKTHDRRRHAAAVLGAVGGLQVCYVYCVKRALRPDSYLGHPQRFYNYVAYKIYKSALWAARGRMGSNALVWTRFGHVKHHDHRSTEAYIRREASHDPKVPFQLEQGLKWVSAGRYQESQVADIYAGFLKAALWPGGEFGLVEPTYLLSVWHQLRNSSTCAIPLGLMSMPSSELVGENAWFPCRPCPKVNGSPGASRGRST